MIQYYCKIAFRNILKYKIQSIISIIGLAVGFTCFALSNLWIHYEITYDKFYEGVSFASISCPKTSVEPNNDIAVSSVNAILLLE